MLESVYVNSLGPGLGFYHKYSLVSNLYIKRDQYMFNGFTVIVIQKHSEGFLAMPRTKYRSLRRPVRSGKRSRKPKENNDDG